MIKEETIENSTLQRDKIKRAARVRHVGLRVDCKKDSLYKLINEVRARIVHMWIIISIT